MTQSEGRYGLRHDPQRFIDEDTSLQGALVRTFVVHACRDSDAAMLQAEIDRVRSEQRDDGTFGGKAKHTGSQLMRLLELGLDPGDDAVTRAASAILRQGRSGDIANEWYEHGGEVLNVYSLHALCLLDCREEEVVRSLRLFVERQHEWNDPWEGCPWTPEVFWSALWAGRAIDPSVEEAIAVGMRRITQDMNAAGCCGYNDPWGLLQATGQIARPEAAQMLGKQIPMILRGQRDDGGWGGRSFHVFRALDRHGLMDQLRDRPALPADWQVTRSVPCPEGQWFSLVWDGSSLWSVERGRSEAVALSPQDGHEVKRLGIANCVSVGWWDDALAAVGGDPKELKRVDPDTGEVRDRVSLEKMEDVLSMAVVDGQLVVGDGFMCSTCIITADDRDERRWQTLAGPGPKCLAPAGDTIWHADFWAPGLMRSDLSGNLIEWGDQPWNVQGLAHDGQQLWVLDGDANQLHAIRRATV